MTEVLRQGRPAAGGISRRWLVRAATALVAVGPVMAITAAEPATATAGAVTAASAAPYCGITWGSLPKTAAGMSSARVLAVRAGEHTCYDRLVIDVAGRAGGYLVQYVDQVRADGSGAVVPVAGGARLQLTVFDPAYGPTGSYLPRDRAHVVDVRGYPTFRQVAWAGSFEGYTTLALGVRARLPFRVFVLPGPGTHSRIVIDVAHRW